MAHLPVLLHALSILITAGFFWMFYTASVKSRTVLLISFLWLAFQALLSMSGFYQVTSGIPPRFLALILPPILLIILTLITTAGRRFSSQLELPILTLLHTLRIPVELMLFGLAHYKVIPGLMTFEGRNFDIISGLTAPLIYYFGFVKKTLPKTLIIAWNVVCMGLLINVVVYAIFSASTEFQRFSFDQPNIAVTHFPFVWLPCFIVPVVVYAHLATIRQLIRR